MSLSLSFPAALDFNRYMMIRYSEQEPEQEPEQEQLYNNMTKFMASMTLYRATQPKCPGAPKKRKRIVTPTINSRAQKKLMFDPPENLNIEQIEPEECHDDDQSDFLTRKGKGKRRRIQIDRMSEIYRSNLTNCEEEAAYINEAMYEHERCIASFPSPILRHGPALPKSAARGPSQRYKIALKRQTVIGYKRGKSKILSEIQSGLASFYNNDDAYVATDSDDDAETIIIAADQTAETIESAAAEISPTPPHITRLIIAAKIYIKRIDLDSCSNNQKLIIRLIRKKPYKVIDYITLADLFSIPTPPLLTLCDCLSCNAEHIFMISVFVKEGFRV